MEKFISVIHFTKEGKRYVTHYENPASNCIDASNYTKELVTALEAEQKAKDIKADTHFLNRRSFAIREEITSCLN